MLASVGFSDQLMHAPVGSLSGGWRMRLALSRAMLQQPELLLLDEPTNHVDVHGVEWLTKCTPAVAWRRAWRLLSAVTHCRHFLVSPLAFLTDAATVTDIQRLSAQAISSMTVTYGYSLPLQTSSGSRPRPSPR